MDFPPILSLYSEKVAALKADCAVKEALKIALDEQAFAMREQVEICEIPAPTFEEKVRGEDIIRRMKLYGLTDVKFDEIGNVIGIRHGTGHGPKLALVAHMDTVFDAATSTKVRQEGNRYFAPGIGDNASGIRVLLQTIRALNQAKIETEGDIYFVCTVGEEALGDIRGAKHFVNTVKVDGFVGFDLSGISRVLKGAVGSHRWRMTVTGPGGHSFGKFGEVPSAIHAMCLAGARVAHIKVPTDPKTSFTIGTIKGGTTVNTIAAQCSAEIDMRSLDNASLLAVEKEIFQCFEEAVAEENAIWGITDPEMQVHLTKECIGNRPAGLRPDDCPVVQASRAALDAIGVPMTKYDISSTDANAAMALNIPSTCLCTGGVQSKVHTVNEYFDCVDIYQASQLSILTTLTLVGLKGDQALLPKRD